MSLAFSIAGLAVACLGVLAISFIGKPAGTPTPPRERDEIDHERMVLCTVCHWRTGSRQFTLVYRLDIAEMDLAIAVARWCRAGILPAADGWVFLSLIIEHTRRELARAAQRSSIKE